MITVQNSTIIIENLTHATAISKLYNGIERIEVQMNDGYVFWDKRDYTYNGIYEEPAPEEICYSRWGSFIPTNDFSTLIEAVESEVPADQIFGATDPNPPEVM